MRRCFGWKSAEAVPLGKRSRRGVAATVTLATLLGGFYPLIAQASADDAQRVALDMINRQSCTQRLPRAMARTWSRRRRPRRSRPPPEESPAPVTTPGLPQAPPGVGNGTYQLNPTPRPFPGQTPSVTPPPIPRGTPNPTPSYEPIFLIRGGETPPPIPSGRAGDADAESGTERRADAGAGIRRGDLGQVDRQSCARATERRHRQRARLLRRRRDRRRARAFRRRCARSR